MKWLICKRPDGWHICTPTQRSVDAAGVMVFPSGREALEAYVRVADRVRVLQAR